MSFSTLPTELQDQILTELIGADIDAVLIRRRLPDISAFSSARLTDRAFNSSIASYRKPNSRICFSTDIFPFLGFYSRTTNQPIIPEGHMIEKQAERSDKFTASGLNTAKILVFPRSQGPCKIAPAVPSYLREWCKSDPAILRDLTTVLYRPTLEYTPPAEPAPDHSFSDSKPWFPDESISQLANDLQLQRTKSITVHAPFSSYETSAAVSSRCVWHGDVLQYLGVVGPKSLLPGDGPIDHRFHLQLTDPSAAYALGSFYWTVREVAYQQARLMKLTSANGSQSVTGLYLTIWGDDATIARYQFLLDDGISEASLAPTEGTFIGIVRSRKDAVEEPFGEWYR